jgi:hypothetical protein
MAEDASNSDQFEIPPLTGVHAEPFSFRKLLRMCSFFGPAALVASLSLGAGETIMVTGLGAWSEFRLLWLLLLSVVVKGVFVTYLCGRYTAITGQPIAQRLVMLPGPRGWLLLIVVVAEVGLISMGLTTVAKPCGNLITFLLQDTLPSSLSFAAWENLITNVFLAAALGMSLFSSLHMLERQQVVICGVLVLGTTVATVIVQPDIWSFVVGAIRVGQMPAVPEWAPPAARNEYTLNLVAIFGYVGGGLSGYLAYSSWVGMRGWGMNAHPQIDSIRRRAASATRIDFLPDDAEQAQRLKTLLSPLRWDVGLGAAVLLIVTAAFLAAGATVLYPRQEVIGANSWELLTKQASIWRQIHLVLAPVYYVVVLAALWGTLATVPEAVTRVTHEYLSAVWPRFRDFSTQKLKYILIPWLFVTSLAWTWSGVSFDLMVQIGAFLTLSLGLFVVFSCVLYFNVALPPRYRPSWWVTAGGLASALVLLLCAIGGAVGLANKLL